MAKTISATVTINAAPAEVWAVLSDVGRWPEWRPHVSRATGAIQAGSRVAVARVLPSGRTVITRTRIVAVQPGVEARARSALGAESSFKLNPIDSGTRTEFVNSSSVPGHLVWLLWLVFALAGRKWAADAQTRLDRVNQALKRRTEQDPDV